MDPTDYEMAGGMKTADGQKRHHDRFEECGY